MPCAKERPACTKRDVHVCSFVGRKPWVCKRLQLIIYVLHAQLVGLLLPLSVFIRTSAYSPSLCIQYSYIVPRRARAIDDGHGHGSDTEDSHGHTEENTVNTISTICVFIIML